MILHLRGCGNTVNITASELAGVDVDEPLTPYAHAMFQFFRNPICQEMGRKFKMSFSSSDKDTALSYYAIDYSKIVNGERGFKVMFVED
jgi:sulfite reductase (ferredoxin)